MAPQRCSIGNQPSFLAERSPTVVFAMRSGFLVGTTSALGEFSSGRPPKPHSSVSPHAFGLLIKKSTSSEAPAAPHRGFCLSQLAPCFILGPLDGPRIKTNWVHLCSLAAEIACPRFGKVRNVPE